MTTVAPPTDRQQHPAYRTLYDLYRAMGCPAAVDPVDPDDCAGVADESVRALIAAGLLLPQPAASLEGAMVYHRSPAADADQCLCCPGRHVHSRSLAGVADLNRAVYGLLDRVPEGAHVTITVSHRPQS